MVSKTRASQKKNHSAFNDHLQRTLRTLNNFFVEVRIVRSSLANTKQLDWSREMPIRVPSTGRQRTEIRRKGDEIKEIINLEIARRAYEKSIILIVAAVEDYMLSYVRLVLRAHPRLINKSPKGNDGKIAIDFNDLISRGIEGVVEGKVTERLHSISYASPSQLQEYLTAVFKKPVGTKAFHKYFEIKVTRDLIVHAQSIINDTYRTKAGELARGELGQEIPIDEAYYEDVLRVAKQLCVSVYRIMLAEFGDDESITAVVARAGI